MGEKTKGGFSENKFVKAIGAQRLIVLLVVIALFVFFYIAAPSFRNYGTIVTMLDNSYYIGFMAIGVTFTLLTGGVGNIIGTFVGVLSLSTIQNIVSSVGLDEAWWTGITVAAMLCLFLVIQSVITSRKRD